MSHQVRHLYEFGPFRLDPEKPCLWRDGEPISLTPKAVEKRVYRARQLLAKWMTEAGFIFLLALWLR